MLVSWHLFFYRLVLNELLVVHTLVMVYQTISLNVAVNSYDHALLTLLVSNQFVEIKGSVFKKFEKDNLFQITCAGMLDEWVTNRASGKLIRRVDIVERFTLFLMLFVVAFRNLIELSGSEFDLSGGFALPKSFGWFRGNNVLWTISYVSSWGLRFSFTPRRHLIPPSSSHFLRSSFLKRLWIG